MGNSYEFPSVFDIEQLENKIKDFNKKNEETIRKSILWIVKNKSKLLVIQF